MTGIIGRSTLPVAAVVVALVATASTQTVVEPDLSRVAAGDGWTVVRRAAASIDEDGRSGLRLDAREGDGVAWLDGTDFDSGVIELELKGKNVPQQSFLGVAFRGVDDVHYDTVYFRPFNFRAEETARRSHSVQYDSRPDHHWPRLRQDHPGVYEAAIDTPPDPDGWFRIRLVIERPTISVFVNDGARSCLVVEELSGRSGGRVGLWVGNNSGGAFANLRITQTTK